MTEQIFIDAFERISKTVHAAAKGLSEHDLAFRPDETGNSIAWLLWHLARVQDNHIADLMGQEQIWTSYGWNKKFGLPLEDTATGYGHSSEEVGMVQASEALLTGYYDAVQKRTVEYVKSLKDKEYNNIIDPSWDPPVSLRVRLVSIITDDLQHAGQAMYVRGLLQNG